MDSVDVIIPVYRPDNTFLNLLQMLERQTAAVNKIIVINTEEKYFEALIRGTDFWNQHKNVMVKHIHKREFNHGRTRNHAIKLSGAEYFLLMTQDAVPADEHLVENLLAGIKKDGSALAYARHLPAWDACIIEKFTRSFNYPDQSVKKTGEDIQSLGIKAFFCSNVCALYDRKIFDSLGGFVDNTIFNEDMIYGNKVVISGHSIFYAADALVYHSHNYSNRQQFKRNFDLGVSHAQFPSVFSGIPTEREGFKLINAGLAYFSKASKVWMFLPFIIQSAYKYMGYFLGKRYRKLPVEVVKKCTTDQSFWS